MKQITWDDVKDNEKMIKIIEECNQKGVMEFYKAFIKSCCNNKEVKL